MIRILQCIQRVFVCFGELCFMYVRKVFGKVSQFIKLSWRFSHRWCIWYTVRV